MHTYVLGTAKPTDARVTNSERLNHMDKGNPKQEESSYFPAKIAATAAGGAAATVQDFKEAKAAGVDAFALLIGKGAFPRSQFTDSLNLLASVAQTQDTKIIPDVLGGPLDRRLQINWAQYKALHGCTSRGVCSSGWQTYVFSLFCKRNQALLFPN